MIRNNCDIIKRPLITEKTMKFVGLKRYFFEVDMKSNKISIRKAVEEVFKTKVKKVNTMIVHGKVKRVGGRFGRTSDWKKAIVTLDPKSKPIEFFDSLS